MIKSQYDALVVTTSTVVADVAFVSPQHSVQAAKVKSTKHSHKVEAQKKYFKIPAVAAAS